MLCSISVFVCRLHHDVRAPRGSDQDHTNVEFKWLNPLARARVETINLLQWLVRIENSYLPASLLEERFLLQYRPASATFITKPFDQGLTLALYMPSLEMQFHKDAKAVPHVFDPDRADRSSFTFGAGRHACAGQAIATAVAAAGIQALMAHGLDIAALAGPVAYRKAVNSRIPIFGGAT